MTWARRHAARQRDGGGRDQATARPTVRRAAGVEPDELAAAGPPPDAALLNRETIDRWLDALGDPLLGDILTRRLRREAVEEIAGSLGRTHRRIERKLATIRALLTPLLGPEPT